METINDLPEPYVDLMITFQNEHGSIVTKRGFYCKLFETFSIPPSYQMFNGALLPHGFGGEHIDINSKKIKNWKLIK